MSKMSHLTNVLLPQTSYHHSLPISTMYQSPIGFQWFSLQQKFIPIFSLFIVFFPFFLYSILVIKQLTFFSFFLHFIKKNCGFLCSHICDLFIIYKILGLFYSLLNVEVFRSSQVTHEERNVIIFCVKEFHLC